MESRFKYYTYAHPLWLIGVIIVLFTNLTSEQSFNAKTFYIIPVVLLWGLYDAFDKLRNEIIKIKINEKEVAIKRFYGLWPESVYQLSGVDGYYTSFTNGYHSYDFLVIVCKGKKIAKISDYYHSNYDYLLSEAEERIHPLDTI